MRISKWGNNLAVRLPASIVKALNLKQGDDIEIHVVGARELLARLRKYRGRLPADFKFDRIEANARR